MRRAHEQTAWRPTMQGQQHPAYYYTFYIEQHMHDASHYHMNIHMNLTTNFHEVDELETHPWIQWSFDPSLNLWSWMTKSSRISDPTCPSSPCCGPASFTSTKNLTQWEMLKTLLKLTQDAGCWVVGAFGADRQHSWGPFYKGSYRLVSKSTRVYGKA